MAEPTVQVPVSLIERAVRVLDDGSATVYEWDAVQDELTALLSQPTPTTETSSCVICSRSIVRLDLKDGTQPWRHAEGTNAHPAVGPLSNGQAAEPPRIEDMAPGTTFTAEVPDRWLVQVESDGALFADTCVERKSLEHIDPSTIRDVQEPKGAAS